MVLLQQTFILYIWNMLNILIEFLWYSKGFWFRDEFMFGLLVKIDSNKIKYLHVKNENRLL